MVCIYYKYNIHMCIVPIPVNRPDEKNYPTFPRQFIVFNKQITVIIHLNNVYIHIILLYPYARIPTLGLPGASRRATMRCDERINVWCRAVSTRDTHYNMCDV